MNKIFVLIEEVGQSVDESSLELAAVAASMVGDGGQIVGLAAGSGITASVATIAAWFDEIYVWDDDRLSVPDGEQRAALVLPVIEQEAPDLVVAAHTNNAMDFVPGLAVRLQRPLVTDCLSVAVDGDAISAVRPVYGGKVNARVRASVSSNGYMVTLRPGAVHAETSPGRAGKITRRSLNEPLAVQRRIVRTLTSDATDVDISQAERLVAVGRGIEDEESLEMIRSLAEAMGAEVACSRPVVDKQWLPKSRQVGTSGKSVRPKVYVAIGISGSFQHMGGIKGDPFLVAINKDPRAPIFTQADVGIVGDLFDVVPVLLEKIRAITG